MEIKHKEEKAAQKHYDRNVEYFDKSNLLNAAMSTDTFKQILNDNDVNFNDNVILDVGCGTGETINFLLQHEPTIKCIHGIDYSKKRIDQARSVIKNVPVQQVELYAEDLNIFLDKMDDLRFDIIFAFEIIEHLKDPETIMDTLKKLLKPNGMIIGTVPIQQKPNNIHLTAFTSEKNIIDRLDVDIYSKYKMRFNYQKVFIYFNKGNN